MSVSERDGLPAITNVLREEVYMKNKKATRTLALALCAAMLTGSLAACGGKTDSGSSGSTGNATGTRDRSRE